MFILIFLFFCQIIIFWLAINNVKKIPPIDFKTEMYLENVRVLNQIDEIMKIQKKAAAIDSIKLMKQKQKEKSNQVF